MARSALRSVHDLAVFQRAYKASLRIHILSRKFPKEEQYGLADQLRRATKSICANLTEGFAKRHVSSAEFKRFLMMSFGSSEEVLLWLDYCHDLKIMNAQTANKAKQEYTEISKMIFTLHRQWKAA
jgi:four helix bundle protein